MTRRGVTAHSSSGAEIWGAAWLTSLMWILPSHKTSKLAECVIILAANQPSICEWNYTTVSQRNLASSGLWDLLSFQFHLFDCNDKHIFFSQFKFAYLLDFSIIALHFLWGFNLGIIPRLNPQRKWERTVFQELFWALHHLQWRHSSFFFFFLNVWGEILRMWPDIGMHPHQKGSRRGFTCFWEPQQDDESQILF